MARWRSWCLFFGLSLGAAAGCTSKNPAATCSQGTCIDPNFPYCDLDGAIGGEPGTCIAVTCTTGEFGKCSGDTAYTCNQFGTGYDQVDCAHGCDEAQSGCRLCEPNQTACTNGMVATCDANGNQTITQQCPLGCFEDQPRCRDVAPSNHLANYLDTVSAPVDLDLSTGEWYLNTVTGVLVDSHSMPGPMVDSFLVNSPSGGPPMRVLVAKTVKLGSLHVDGAYPSSATLVLLASGDVLITGPMAFSDLSGGITDAACIGHRGGSGYTISGAVGAYAPGGGGGVSVGGEGGAVIEPDGGARASGGGLHGSDDLQPLVGGCAGGGFLKVDGTSIPYGGAGGGAVQITSRGKIVVSGSIHVDGRDGEGHASGPGDIDISGAGAGGAILLEAPSVELTAGSSLTAKGGDGFGCDPPNEFCVRGGKGGTSVSAATGGDDIAWVNAAGPNAEFDAGGGGGSVGRIRINTPTNSFIKDSASIQNALVTTGSLSTR